MKANNSAISPEQTIPFDKVVLHLVGIRTQLQVEREGGFEWRARITEVLGKHSFFPVEEPEPVAIGRDRGQDVIWDNR